MPDHKTGETGEGTQSWALYLPYLCRLYSTHASRASPYFVNLNANPLISEVPMLTSTLPEISYPIFTFC